MVRNVIAPATEEELGRLFGIFQESTSVRTALAKVRQQQPPTTTNNHQHRWQRTIQWKKELSVERKNKKIHSNRHDILLRQRQNTTKPFPHIMGGRKEKSIILCHKKPPNLSP